MAETDILNPSKRIDPTFRDNLNPNIGWQRSRANSLAVAKPAFGRPWSRESSNGGVSYQLSFTKRSLAVIERLQRFADEFEAGFFTLIDHDNGRHYVGRFTGTLQVTKELGKRFTASNWTFEEVPGAPMLQYPAEWERWSVVQRPFDEWGDQKTATMSALDAGWIQPAGSYDSTGIQRPSRTLALTQPTIGDWAQHEYRGYGFRLWLDRNPTAGVVQIYVDGVLVQDNLVLTAATSIGPVKVYENTAMSLDIHRVKVVLIAATPAATTLAGFTWDRIEVMR